MEVVQLQVKLSSQNETLNVHMDIIVGNMLSKQGYNYNTAVLWILRHMPLQNVHRETMIITQRKKHPGKQLLGCYL